MKFSSLKLRMFVTALFAVVTSICSAQVNVNVRIDSLDLLIGEQTAIHLEVNLNSGQKLTLPVLKDTLVRGVELVEISVPDTVMLNDGKRMTVSLDYLITSFDSALYYIPPFKVVVDGRAYESKSLALKVGSIPVDTVHYDQFFGPKDVMRPPFVWADWALIFWMSVLMVIMLVVAIYLFIRYRDNKPLIKHILVAQPLPPHKKAISQIDAIKADNLARQEDSKEYYTRLTDTLRTYIQERYGFSALEMTSAEIIAKLMEVKGDDDLRELRMLFETADLVKFAKYNTLINENDANLVNAIDFINQTKIEVDPNAPAPKPVYTVEEQRSRRSKIVLGVSIFVLSVAILASLGFVAYRIYELSF